MTHVRHTLLISLLVLTGCATTQSLPVENRSRIFDAAYNEVFRSIVDVLMEQGYVIETMDLETGIISTDYLASDALTTALIGGSRSKVTAMLTDEPAGTEVVLTLVEQSSNAFGQQSSMMLAPGTVKKMYNDLFEAITAKIDT